MRNAATRNRWRHQVVLPLKVLQAVCAAGVMASTWLCVKLSACVEVNGVVVAKSAAVMPAAAAVEIDAKLAAKASNLVKLNAPICVEVRLPTCVVVSSERTPVLNPAARAPPRLLIWVVVKASTTPAPLKALMPAKPI